MRLQAVKGHRAYKIHSGFAVSSHAPDPHIIDSPDKPFQDNLIEIVKVSYRDCEIPFDKPKGIYIPNPDTVYIDGTVFDEDTYEVEFIADHPLIEYFDAADLEQDIDLPMAYLQALLYFVASRFITANNAQISQDYRSQHSGTQYRQLYEMECQKLQEQGIEAEHTDERTQFQKRGFI